MVFLWGLDFDFKDFLGRSILYNRYNAPKNNPINMYSILSTLMINIQKGIKNPPLGGSLYFG